MIPVRSSAISAVGYDKDFQRMCIKFKDGQHPYTFCRVPENVYQSLMSASSKGGYFDNHIKDKYDC